MVCECSSPAEEWVEGTVVALCRRRSGDDGAMVRVRIAQPPPQRAEGEVGEEVAEDAEADPRCGSNREVEWRADRVWRIRSSVCARGWSDLHPPTGARLLGGGDSRRIAMRDAFAARPGCVLISADYCQVEMRLMAHFSQDDALLEALRAHSDLFIPIAASMFHVAPARVSSAQRDRAKKVSYAILYGQGARGIATELGIAESRARELIEHWHAACPGVTACMKATLSRCRQLGYVESLGGRRRYLPGIASADESQRREAERQAVNTLCQASAADLIKKAMVTIDGALLAAAGGGAAHGAMSGRLLLQIHDELLLEVAEAHAPPLRKLVRDAMAGAYSLRNVPLEVKLRQGSTWGSLEPVPVVE